MRRYILLSLAVLIVLVLILSYYKNHNHDKGYLLLYGNVDVRQVDLGFRVTGRIEKMLFEEGNVVEPGTLMAALDKQPYADQVNQAEANVDSNKQSLQNSEILFKRRQDLITDGSVSQEDLDNALSSKNVFAANLKAAQAALSVAQLNLAYTELYAPSAGTILTRIREPGSVVLVSDPIYTLSIISPVWIRAFVNELELGKVYPDMPAEIFTDTPGGKVYKGHIGFISPVAEFTPKTVETTQLRTDLVYRLRVIADNPDQGLRQGMPVTVKLQIGHNKLAGKEVQK